MRPDDFTNTEADAAYYEQIRGATEDSYPAPMTAYDCEPNPLLDAPYARNRPDPWEPFTCQRCGSVNSDGMPAKCDGCGMRNWGEES